MTALSVAIAVATLSISVQADDALVPYRVVGDTIPEPIGGLTGDAAPPQSAI